MPGHTISARSNHRWEHGTIELHISVAGDAQGLTNEQRDAFEQLAWFVDKMTKRWNEGGNVTDLMAALERSVAEVAR